MLTYLLEMLACPMCHGEAKQEISKHTGKRTEQADIRCQECAAVRPVGEGIGLLPIPEADACGKRRSR